MNDPLSDTSALCAHTMVYSEPPFISENIAEVSKVDYSSNAKSCNVLEYCTRVHYFGPRRSSVGHAGQLEKSKKRQTALPGRWRPFRFKYCSLDKLC